MSGRVIIGIHGLKNKPEADILEDWWKTSIDEGLSRHCGGRKFKVRFEMVYWADLLYGEAIAPEASWSRTRPPRATGRCRRAGLSVRKVTTARVRGAWARRWRRSPRCVWARRWSAAR